MWQDVRSEPKPEPGLDVGHLVPYRPGEPIPDALQRPDPARGPGEPGGPGTVGVAEPGTLLLLAAGVLSVAVVRRRDQAIRAEGEAPAPP